LRDGVFRLEFAENGRGKIVEEVLDVIRREGFFAGVAQHGGHEFFAVVFDGEGDRVVVVVGNDLLNSKEIILGAEGHAGAEGFPNAFADSFPADDIPCLVEFDDGGSCVDIRVRDSWSSGVDKPGRGRLTGTRGNIGLELCGSKGGDVGRAHVACEVLQLVGTVHNLKSILGKEDMEVVGDGSTCLMKVGIDEVDEVDSEGDTG
jgi:hypothetical protein